MFITFVVLLSNEKIQKPQIRCIAKVPQRSDWVDFVMFVGVLT